MFTSLLLTTVIAQAVVSPVASSVSNSSPFKFTPTVDANVSVYSFKSSANLVEVAPSVTFADVLETVDITVDLPLYFQNGTSSDKSGVSDLGVTATKSLWNGTAFGGKTVWSGDFGILLPLANETFSSTSLVPVVGTSVRTTWDKLTFSQSVNWTILANGSSWNTLLNSHVDSQWVNGETRLDYKLADSLTVGVLMSEQWVTTGETSVLVGPEVSWTPATNWKVSAGVGFAVYQDTKAYDSVNNVVNVGIGFSF